MDDQMTGIESGNSANAAANTADELGELPSPDGAPGIIGALAKMGGGLSRGLVSGGNIIAGQPANASPVIQPKQPMAQQPVPQAVATPQQPLPAPQPYGLQNITQAYNDQRRNDFLNNLTGALDARFAGRINQ